MKTLQPQNRPQTLQRAERESPERRLVRSLFTLGGALLELGAKYGPAIVAEHERQERLGSLPPRNADEGERAK